MESLAYFQVNEKYLRKCWKEVREDVWGDLKRETQAALKKLLESGMEFQVQDLVGSESWKHNERRGTYRNGCYSRGLLTGLGYISDIRVPRVRQGNASHGVLKRYQRRSPDVDAMVQEMFLSGVSTRKVKEVLEPLLGCESISATTVSNIAKSLDREVFKYHNRNLLDEYVYLILDGIYIKSKSPVHSRRRCVLAAYGIRQDGTRELIDFQLTKRGESQEAWEIFFGRLYHRGLEGKYLKCVVIDGNKGLWNALRLFYPYVRIQRCWAHKLRNVASQCPRRIQEEVMCGTREIYRAESRAQALQIFRRWEKKWREIVPKAVECLEEDLEELLRFYDLPSSDWKKMRTTNIIERVFREVRRRTRPMSCFQNSQSVERIVFAIFFRLNKLWSLKKGETRVDSEVNTERVA